MQTVAYLRWRDGNTLVVAEESRDGPLEHWFQRSDRLWKPIRAPASKRNRIRLEVRQSIETPPTIVAIDVASRAERIAFDPNPNLLKRFKFGRVDRVEGQLANGAEWDGLLFYPTDYVEGNKYPLVIQSVYENISPTFTLYGSTPLGPPEISAYPGRLLANRNVFVLHLNMRIGAKANTPAEAEARMAAFEQVPRQLAAKGLVDFERVGLIGFSRNAYYVEYTVTHSNTHFAAALSADGFDASYVPITMMGDMVNGAALIGQPPFGSGLEQWLERAPGFNVDRVNTPLRKIQQSFGTFGLLLNWEVFSRLRYLEKPVELYLVPDYERGAHNSQNPRQIIAVLQSTVDWFDFWLNGREDLSPEKSDQYKNWHRLRDLTSRASATPHQP